MFIEIDQDEDGVWCAHAQLRPGLGANGAVETVKAALDDLCVALAALVEEVEENPLAYLGLGADIGNAEVMRRARG